MKVYQFLFYIQCTNSSPKNFRANNKIFKLKSLLPTLFSYKLSAKTQYALRFTSMDIPLIQCLKHSKAKNRLVEKFQFMHFLLVET